MYDINLPAVPLRRLYNAVVGVMPSLPQKAPRVLIHAVFTSKCQIWRRRKIEDSRGGISEPAPYSRISKTQESFTCCLVSKLFIVWY